MLWAFAVLVTNYRLSPCSGPIPGRPRGYGLRCVFTHCVVPGTGLGCLPLGGAGATACLARCRCALFPSAVCRSSMAYPFGYALPPSPNYFGGFESAGGRGCTPWWGGYQGGVPGVGGWAGVGCVRGGWLRYGGTGVRLLCCPVRGWPGVVVRGCGLGWCVGVAGVWVGGQSVGVGGVWVCLAGCRCGGGLVGGWCAFGGRVRVGVGGLRSCSRSVGAVVVRGAWSSRVVSPLVWSWVVLRCASRDFAGATGSKIARTTGDIFEFSVF